MPSCGAVLVETHPAFMPLQASVAEHRPPPAADPAPARAPQSDPDLDAGLDLAKALALLQRAGHALPAELQPGSPAWLQQIVDGLCALSSSDPLTGLNNRRIFETALEQELDRVARSGEPALLLVLDIDHFKQVNDRWGHAAGDIVIQRVARAMQDCVRPMDTCARLGGEEFGVVLPHCPAPFSETVAERIRARIEGQAIDIGGGRSIRVTISIGGAFAPQWVRSSAGGWMERADQRLYQAKTQGRNQACLERPPISEVSAEERGMLFTAAPDLDVDDNSTTP